MEYKKGERTMNLSELLLKIRNHQVARAYFGGETWYVTKSVGCLRYCTDMTGLETGEIVPLTKSNMEAEYELMEVE